MTLYTPKFLQFPSYNAITPSTLNVIHRFHEQRSQQQQQQSRVAKENVFHACSVPLSICIYRVFETLALADSTRRPDCCVYAPRRGVISQFISEFKPNAPSVLYAASIIVSPKRERFYYIPNRPVIFLSLSIPLYTHIIHNMRKNGDCESFEYSNEFGRGTKVSLFFLSARHISALSSRDVRFAPRWQRSFHSLTVCMRARSWIRLRTATLKNTRNFRGKYILTELSSTSYNAHQSCTPKDSRERITTRFHHHPILHKLLPYSHTYAAWTYAFMCMCALHTYIYVHTRVLPRHATLAR